MNLKPGEVICEVCNGQGHVNQENDVFSDPCYYCYGTGKLDWIENIVGKTLPVFQLQSPLEWVFYNKRTNKLKQYRRRY
jgi:hypothetical protein